MRQKIGIIQALQHDPELAILDEPSEGLDPLMQRAFYGCSRTCAPPAGRSSSRRTCCPKWSGCATAWRSSGTGRLVALEDVPVAAGAAEAERRASGSPGRRPTLDGVPGVSDVRRRATGPTCRLEGDVGPFLAAIAGAAITDLTIEPARLEEAFLEFYDEAERPGAGGLGMNGALFLHTWRAYRVRLLIVTAALLVWGLPARHLRLVRGAVPADARQRPDPASSSPSSAAATSSA